MIELILPWPPTVNHYKKVGALITTKKGKLYQKRVNTNETKLFYYQVWLNIKAWIAKNRMKTPLDSMISMELYLYPPDKRKRDIDNVVKPMLDSLVKGGLIQDDSQINRLLIVRCDIVKQGQILVVLTETKG